MLRRILSVPAETVRSESCEDKVSLDYIASSKLAGANREALSQTKTPQNKNFKQKKASVRDVKESSF